MMRSSGWFARCWRVVLCGVLLIIGSCATFAQRGPDELLLEQAKRSYSHHDVDSACKTLRYLCMNYPRTSVTDAGVVMLYTIDLSEGKASEAEQLNADVLDNWPKSEICWQFVEARFRWQVKTDRVPADKWLLHTVGSERRLPDDAWTRALRLRLEFALKPGEILAEEMQRLGTLLDEADRESAEALRAEAAQLYPMLFPAGLIEQAAQLHQRLQARLIDNRRGAQADEQAFHGGVTPELLNGLYALARHAKIEQDREQHARVLRQLELLAPDSPQTLRVRGMAW